MIVKNIKGKGFRGLLDYVLSGSIDGSENKRAVIIGTNMAGASARELATEFGALRKLRPQLGKAVAHFSLSLPPHERDVSDEGFHNMALLFLNGMGYDHVPYLIIRHHDTEHSHIHIVASRVRTDGSVVSDKNDFHRAQTLSREIEVKFDLIPLDEEASEAPNINFQPQEKGAGMEKQPNKSATGRSRYPRRTVDKSRWGLGWGDGDPIEQNTERELRRDIFAPEWLEVLNRIFRVESRKIEKHTFGIEIHFRDGGSIKDFGSRVEAAGMAEEQAARRCVEMAEAKGWAKVHFFGSDAFVRAAMAEALARGIEPIPQTADQAMILAELISSSSGGAVGVAPEAAASDDNGVPPHLRSRQSRNTTTQGQNKPIKPHAIRN